METKAIDAILSRRSIRKFSGKTVNESAIETLLKAAMSAPSAHNQQPWEFVVITNRDILDSIPSYHPYSKMLLQAPAAIMVCGRTEGLPEEGFWPQDCSAATQNILVAANSLGLGSVWLGIYPNQELVENSRKVCGIPSGITPFCFVALGYPAEEKGPSKRFDPDRIHMNRW